MLHAIVGLLDDLAYIDSYVTYTTMESGLARRLYCKRLTPCSRNGSGHTRLDFLYTYTVEDLEFLDTPVHIHLGVVTMHEYKIIMIVLIASV